MGLGDLFVYSVFTSSNTCYCSMPNFIPQKGENVNISNIGKFCCNFFYYKDILGHHEFIYFRIRFIFFINVSPFCFFLFIRFYLWKNIRNCYVCLFFSISAYSYRASTDAYHVIRNVIGIGSLFCKNLIC